MKRPNHTRVLALLVLACLGVSLVRGSRVSLASFDDLPAFPTPPASLLELTATTETAATVDTPAFPPEPAAASLVELDSASDLPASEVALAAAFPSSAHNPLTAALAIEVPNPNTFLKDDVFLQQLEREHIQAEQAEALENGVAVESSQEGFFDDLVSSRPLQEPPRRRGANGARRRAAAQRRGGKKTTEKEDEVARLTDLYNNRRQAKKAGRFLSKKGGIFQGHQRGPYKSRLPEHDQASHQPSIPRTFRSASGHFEKNLAWRETNSPVDGPFPHHGGHVAAPHNKGRKNAKANLPKKPLSRHLRAQRKGSKTNRFPKAKSQRAERAAARRAAAKKRADFLAGKLSKRKARKGRHVHLRKGKGLNGAKAHKSKKGKAGKGRKGKAGKGRKGKAGKGRKGKAGKHGKSGKAGKHAKGGKAGKHGKGGKAGKHHQHSGKGQSGSKAGKRNGVEYDKNGRKLPPRDKRGRFTDAPKKGAHHRHHPKHGQKGGVTQKNPTQPGQPQKNPKHPRHRHHKRKDNSIVGAVGKMLHDKTRSLSKKVEQKSNQLFNKAEKSVQKGISNVADKLKNKVAGWGSFGKLLTKGINKLEDGAHKGVDSARNKLQAGANNAIAKTTANVHNSINTSVQRAKNALKDRFGGFFTMAELKAEIAAQRRKGGAGKKVAAPQTAFASGFGHVLEQRADMRAEAQRFKDEEFAAAKAKADLEKLTAEHAKREAILQQHIDAKFKAHSNLHTMFGASNGVFDRLPTHPSQNTRRGSPAHRSYTPARRIVPARLARLEDLRMQARRRTYARGMMADRYHQQLHGENLGVFAGPGEYTEPDAFLQMNEDGVVHDAPAMRMPPQ